MEPIETAKTAALNTRNQFQVLMGRQLPAQLLGLGNTGNLKKSMVDRLFLVSRSADESMRDKARFEQRGCKNSDGQRTQHGRLPAAVVPEDKIHIGDFGCALPAAAGILQSKLRPLETFKFIDV
jgi:hypothetical protein